MSETICYKARRVFTGTEMVFDHVIITRNNRIESILPASEFDEYCINFDDGLLAPAFVDLQIYGASGRLLAVYPDAETVAAIVKYCEEGGAAYCLPTVATNTYEVIFNCIDAVRSYWNNDGKGVLGLHVEGPWINPEKRGAHRSDWIFSPTLSQAKELLEYGKGVIKMITVAPEVVDPEVIDLIHSYDIVLSAGHTNATFEEANAYFENKITTATHLFNAMPPIHHRKPGIAAAVLNHATVYCSIVPDGHHVDFNMIKLAEKLMPDRLFAITDAVTETTEGYYKHQFDGDKYVSNGILSGSALTMHKCFTNFVNNCDIPLEDALKMCSLIPAKVIGKDNELGYIREGYAVNFIAMDEQLRLIDLIR